MSDDPKGRWPAPNELAECAIDINRVIATSGAESPPPSPIEHSKTPNNSKCGTKLYRLPSQDNMREARRRKRVRGRGVGFFVITDSGVDPNIGACRVAIENIAAARKLTPRGQGRQFDKEKYLEALNALENERLPLRINSRAVSLIWASLNMKKVTAARSLLRRLIDLRKRLAP